MQFFPIARAAILGAAFVLALPHVWAGTVPMYVAAYKEGKARINVHYRHELSACARLPVKDRSGCADKARTKASVARAQLKRDYVESPSQRAAAIRTSAENHGDQSDQ